MQLRPSLLLLSGLLLVGCGDTPQATEDEQTPIEDIDSDKGDDIPSADSLVANIFINTDDDCDAASLEFEGGGYYAQTALTPQIGCHWDFGDGSTSDDCVGRHVYAQGGLYTVTLEVTDLVYGHKATAIQQRLVRGPIEATLEASAPACGLEVSYQGTVNHATEVHVFVEPGAQVVLGDPLYHLNLVNTVQVSAPGVYTVRLSAEDERFDDSICSKEVVKQVTVVACPSEDPDGEDPDGHDHEPGCGH